MEKILLLGFGRSGRSCCEFLLQYNNLDLIIVDDNLTTDDISFLEQQSCSFFNTPDFLKQNIGLDCIIKSPGIHFDHPILEHYQQVLTINDIELTYQLVKKTNIKIIAITGTNGKTSTTLLLTKVLNNAGYKAFSCGNIGTSPLDIITNNRDIDYLVMELSSFQLASICEFAPHIAVILNIAPDHLDYHHTFGDYVNAKMQIIKNLDNMELIVSGYEQLPTNFPVVYIQDDEAMENYGNSISKINVAIVRAIMEFLVIDQQILDDILKNKEFILQHRMEYVDCINNVTFINDSKATNVGATINALEQMKDVILLVGGSSKDEDMHPLGSFLDDVKQVIAFGSNKMDFKFIPGIIIVNQLSEAVEAAYELACSGDTILLSPASASLDQFKNYQDRGNKFKKMVSKIRTKEEK